VFPPILIRKYNSTKHKLLFVIITQLVTSNGLKYICVLLTLDEVQYGKHIKKINTIRVQITRLDN